jgi:hypothetical protein
MASFNKEKNQLDNEKVKKFINDLVDQHIKEEEKEDDDEYIPNVTTDEVKAFQLNYKETEYEYTMLVTNIPNDYTFKQIFDAVDAKDMGTINRMVTTIQLPTVKDTNRTSAYVYYEKWFDNEKNKEFDEKLKSSTEPFPFIEFIDKDGVCDLFHVQKNTLTTHFKSDDYVPKRIIIQSIKSNKSCLDIAYIFREHCKMEHIDMVWVKSEEYEDPTHCQCYYYIEEWGLELFTIKLLEELNDRGVITINYDYNNDERELLWVYELISFDSLSKSLGYKIGFEYGGYKKWIPEDDPIYGARSDRYNKLNWYFSTEGRFAYAEKTVEDELMKHGGLYLGNGTEKKLYPVKIKRRPVDFRFNDNKKLTEEDLNTIKNLLIDALQKGLENFSIGKQGGDVVDEDD